VKNALGIVAFNEKELIEIQKRIAESDSPGQPAGLEVDFTPGVSGYRTPGC
jgi:hypothetical protein